MPTLEEERHKELLAAINGLKSDNEKFLPKQPYKDMLAPFRYFYEHPKLVRTVGTLLVVAFIDMLFELKNIGLLSALIKFLQ